MIATYLKGGNRVILFDEISDHLCVHTEIMPNKKIVVDLVQNNWALDEYPRSARTI